MAAPSEHTNPDDAPRDPSRPTPEGKMPDLSKEGMRSARPEPGGEPAPERADQKPTLREELFTLGLRADAATDLVNELASVRAFGGEIDDQWLMGFQTAKMQRVAAFLDQSAAPPIDDRARELVTAVAYGKAPYTLDCELKRMAVYYDTWDEAFLKIEGRRDRGKEPLYDVPAPDQLALPESYRAALEAGDRVSLELERQVAPPVDESALALIRDYARDALPAEMHERVDQNVKYFLSWQLAADAEFDRLNGVPGTPAAYSASTTPAPERPAPEGRSFLEEFRRDLASGALADDLLGLIGKAIHRTQAQGAVMEEIDQSLAPPIDEDARRVIRLAVRDMLPEDLERACERLADYYQSWADAKGEEEDAFFDGEPLPPGEDAGADVQLPPAARVALEAGDRLLLEWERTAAPPLDDRAREQIARYVRGDLAGEVADRIEAAGDKYLTWWNAIQEETRRQER